MLLCIDDDIDDIMQRCEIIGMLLARKINLELSHDPSRAIVKLTNGYCSGFFFTSKRNE